MSNIIFRTVGGPASQTGGVQSSNELTLQEMDNNFYAIDVTTDGTAEASKALILDASKEVGTLQRITIDRLTHTGELTAPASKTAAGTTGDIRWERVDADNGYIYICTATNEWQRVAIASWV